MTLRLSLALLFGGLFSASAFDSSAPVVREPGAMYLSDFGSKPLRTAVLRPANAYFHIEMKDYAGTLRPGQTVEVVAVAESGQAYRVRGKAQQGQILGWVSPADLQPLDPDLVKNMKKAEERRKLVNALIAQNEVAIGMTADEVRQSLGKPAKQTRKASQSGMEQIWEYVKYASIPQQVTSYDAWGNLVTSTIYVQKPVGKLTVTFTGDLVSSLEQSEGTILSGNKVQFVIPPINVYE